MKKKWLFTLLACGFVYTTGCSETNYATPVSGGGATLQSASEQVVVWKQVKNPEKGEGLVQKEVHEALSVLTAPTDIAARLIDLLKAQKDGSEFLPTVPSEVMLLSSEYKDKTLTLNFNDAVSKLQDDQQRLFIQSVNYTMAQNLSDKAETEFKTLVYQIDGKTVKTLADSELGCLKGELCHEPFASNS